MSVIVFIQDLPHQEDRERKTEREREERKNGVVSSQMPKETKVSLEQ